MASRTLRNVNTKLAESVDPAFKHGAYPKRDFKVLASKIEAKLAEGRANTGKVFYILRKKHAYRPATGVTQRTEPGKVLRLPVNSPRTACLAEDLRRERRLRELR